MFCGSIIILLALATNLFAQPIRNTIIPASEHEAYQELSRGALSYSTYSALKVWYTKPLSIPDGECDELRQVFTFLNACELPTIDTLAAYVPWNTSAQKRFLKDFPSLISFLPLTTFTPHNTGALATRLSLTKHSNVDTIETKVSFDVRTPSLLRLSSVISLSETIARFSRRSIIITPSKELAVCVGNFSADPDHGMFLGTHHSLVGSDKTLTNNWLYGDNSLYNGVKASYRGTILQSTSLVHYGFDESAALLNLTSLFPLCALEANVVYVHRNDPAPSDQNRGLTTLRLSSIFHSVIPYIQIGTTLKNQASLPIFAGISVRHQKLFYSLDVQRFPAYFDTGLSQSYKHSTNALDLTKSLIPYPLYCISSMIKASWLQALATDWQAECIAGDTVQSIGSTIGTSFSCASRTVSCRIRGNALLPLQTFTSSATLVYHNDFSPKISWGSQAQISQATLHPLQEDLSIVLEMSPLAALSITPRILISGGTQTPTTGNFGISQKLKLSEESSMQVQCSGALFPLFGKDVAIHVNAQINL